jgi:hypothetical protein
MVQARRLPRGLPFIGGLVAVLLAAAPARADMYFGGAGGASVPLEGDTGWTVLLEMGTDWTSDHVRVGGEAIFSTHDKTIDASALGGSRFEFAIRTYELRFVTRYVMFPGRPTPYIGVGGGLVVVDTGDLSASSLGTLSPLLLRLGEVGVGGGLDGQIGLELPLFSKDLNLFAEGRAKYNWDFSSDLAPFVNEDDTSGYSGILGVRARY